MILDILRQTFAFIDTFFQFCMGDITTNYDRSAQRKTGRYRIFSQFFQNIGHWLVQVDLYGITFTGITQLFRNQATWIRIHLFNPDTLLIDLTFDITVSRAGNSHTYRTGSTVTRQTNDTYVVCIIFTTELSTQTNVVSRFQNFFFQFDITESTAILVTACRQVVIIMSRSQLHGQQVLFC